MGKSAKTGLFAMMLLSMTSCALIQIPLQLIGLVINLVAKLFQAILGLGSAAAIQAAKFAPFAMLFAESPVAPTAPVALPPLMARTQQPLEEIHRAMIQAPEEIFTLEEGLGRAPGETKKIFLVDPNDFLIDSRKEKILSELSGDRIVGMVWVGVQGESRTIINPIDS